MSYAQVPAKYEALQLGDGAQTAFLTALGFTLGDGGWTRGPLVEAVANADGTVEIASAAGPSYTIAVGDWLVSAAYWGTFPGWDGTIASSNSRYTDDQFTIQYSST